MKEVRGETRSVRQLLEGENFTIGYFQREYIWGQEQIRELIDDLVGKFLGDHKPEHKREEVAKYGFYFLGSIIVSRENGNKIITDGQQRLTTLTLVLIYLYHQTKDKHKKSQIGNLIFSQKYDNRSFNLNVPERNACMEELFSGSKYEEKTQSESVINMRDRYSDIKRYFPKKLKSGIIPYFADWLMEKVNLVEITSYSDDDAYTIFETMNDRGLPLMLIDKLKGYLLSNITEVDKRRDASQLWDGQMLALKEEVENHKKRPRRVIFKKRLRLHRITGDDEVSDFIVSWLKSQYAEKTSEKDKKSASRGPYQDDLLLSTDDDFVGIDVNFYRWVRDREKHLKLIKSGDFASFIVKDLAFYSKWYRCVDNAYRKLTKGLEPIYLMRTDDWRFVDIPYALFLAPLKCGEKEEESLRKLRIVAKYIDILTSGGDRIYLERPFLFGHTMLSSKKMSQLIKDIRRKSSAELVQILMQRLTTKKDTFDSVESNVHRLLARITDFVETSSWEKQSRYGDYLDYPYEVEHILPSKAKEGEGEIKNRSKYRDYVGAQLLLPKSINASLGAKSYAEKRDHYLKQNLLAQSLHEKAYENNPGFRRFNEKLYKETGHKFKPYTVFNKEAILERDELYRAIAKKIWDPENLRLELEN